MTALEKVRAWIAAYPGCGELTELRVDDVGRMPNSGGLSPSGLTEAERRRDVLGNVTVTNRYGFTLYFVFPRTPGDDARATANASWVLDFQDWVQAQSAAGQAPVFGDFPQDERITAGDGVLHETGGEGTATYRVRLFVNFKKYYEVKNKWLI